MTFNELQKSFFETYTKETGDLELFIETPREELIPVRDIGIAYEKHSSGLHLPNSLLKSYLVIYPKTKRNGNGLIDQSDDSEWYD